MKATDPTARELAAALGQSGAQKPPGPESLVLRGVLEYLNIAVRGCVAWRQNVGGMQYETADGKRHQMLFGKAGMADVSGLLRGVRLEVEVKAKGKKPGPMQVQWLAFIAEQGGVAFWCDSLEMCAAKLRMEFEKRGWK